MTTTQSLAESCGITAPEVLKAVPGLTYRQLDYWTRTGRVHASGAVTTSANAIDPKRRHRAVRVADPSTPGTGYARLYPPREVEITRRILLLVHVGFEFPTAARIARETLSSGQREVDLGEGVRLTFPAPWWAS